MLLVVIILPGIIGTRPERRCAQNELQAGIQNLKDATKLTDAEKVVKLR